jgi:hypothetical protein
VSFERPTKGQLTFQCDVCFDAFEFSRAEGHNVTDFRECWQTLRDEGWTMCGIEHHCPDCTKIAKADRDNPFRR